MFGQAKDAQLSGRKMSKHGNGCRGAGPFAAKECVYVQLVRRACTYYSAQEEACLRSFGAPASPFGAPAAPSARPFAAFAAKVRASRESFDFSAAGLGDFLRGGGAI
jgi:hypothetical protein